MMIEVPPTSPPQNGPDGRDVTLPQSISDHTSAMNTTVSTAKAHVNQVWILTIVAWPRSPMAIVPAATITNETARARSPWTHPSRASTVSAANVDSATKMISQPTREM
jgi:hypothetical protein